MKPKFLSALLRLLTACLLLSCVACGGDSLFDEEPAQPPQEEQQPQNPAPEIAGNAWWPELPQLVEHENYQYVTHYTTVYSAAAKAQVKARNYTLCFDKTKRGSWWVAYPLHDVHLGSGRPNPDPWAYDPDIATNLQADIVSGSYRGDYDRGHQIPNADRNVDITAGGICYQTFYASNSTPQANELNQNSWAELESKVRTWARGCADTLYVVTGAWWASGSNRTALDRSNNPCPIPDAYFKVVVRTVKGNIRQTGDKLGDYKASDLKAIGFWVENDNSHAEEKPKEWVKSVEEIEQLTGFTFFPTLPAEVKKQKNTSAWSL